MIDRVGMLKYRELIRPALLVQAGILAVSTLEATVVAVLAAGSPVPVLLTAAAMVFVGTAARSGRLSRPLVWTERIIVLTFVIDTAISMLTAGSVLEPMVWLSRLILPLFILRTSRATRKAVPAAEQARSAVEVAA